MARVTSQLKTFIHEQPIIAFMKCFSRSAS